MYPQHLPIHYSTMVTNMSILENHGTGSGSGPKLPHGSANFLTKLSNVKMCCLGQKGEEVAVAVLSLPAALDDDVVDLHPQHRHLHHHRVKPPQLHNSSSLECRYTHAAIQYAVLRIRTFFLGSRRLAMQIGLFVIFF
jgi:hypothetical protein